MRSRVDPDQRPGDPTIGVGQSPHRAASAVRTPGPAGRGGLPCGGRWWSATRLPLTDRAKSTTADHLESKTVLC